MDFIRGKSGLITCICFHLFQIGPLWRYFKIIFSSERADAVELTKLRLLHVLIQSVPIGLLHIETHWNHKHLPPMSILTLTFSFLSLVFCITLHDYYQCQTNNTTIPRSRVSIAHGVAIRFIWHTFFILSRLLSVVLFCSVFRLWIFLLILLHCIIYLTVHAITKHLATTRKHAENETIKRHVLIIITKSPLDLLSGVLDVLEASTHRRLLTVCVLYCVMLSENSAMCLSWYIQHNERSKSLWYLVAVVYASFILASVCVIYYHIKNNTFINKNRTPSASTQRDVTSSESTIEFVNEMSLYTTESCENTLNTKKQDVKKYEIKETQTVLTLDTELLDASALERMHTMYTTSKTDTVHTPHASPSIQHNPSDVSDSALSQDIRCDTRSSRACQSHDSGYHTPPEKTPSSCPNNSSSNWYDSSDYSKERLAVLPASTYDTRSSCSEMSYTIQYCERCCEIMDRTVKFTPHEYNKRHISLQEHQTIIPNIPVRLPCDSEANASESQDNLKDMQIHQINRESLDSRTHCPSERFVKNLFSYDNWTNCMSDTSSDCSSYNDNSYYHNASSSYHNDCSSCWSGTSCSNTWPQDTRVCSYNLSVLPSPVPASEHVKKWLREVEKEDSRVVPQKASPVIGRRGITNFGKRVTKTRVASMDNIYRMDGAIPSGKRTRLNKQNKNGSQQSLWKHLFNKFKL